MTPTADWNGGTPETGSMTGRSKHPSGNVWARRKVRADGTVRLLGHLFLPRVDTVTMPEPGEWLLVFAYGKLDRESRIRSRRDPEHMGEWTSPADPDGYVRRYYWVHAIAKCGCAAQLGTWAAAA